MTHTWVLFTKYQYTFLTRAAIKVASDFLEIFMRIGNSRYSLSIAVFWVISYIKMVFNKRKLIVFIAKYCFSKYPTDKMAKELIITQIFSHNCILVICSPTYTILCAVLLLLNGDITEQNQGGK